MTRPGTLGELRASGWVSRPVKEEVRANAIARIADGRSVVEGVLGYEDTVLPAARERAARRARRHLPRRARPGQDPHHPLAHRACSTSGCRSSPAARSTTTRTRRSRATPATSSPSAATTRRSSGCTATAASARSWPRPTRRSPTSSARSTRSRSPRAATSPTSSRIHYGLVPRTNRGIFAINELPDLAERIQVGLLNVLEERDVQIRGYKIRLPARRDAGRVGQPRGLHEPRPHHHAAQGPLRRPDPHALPARRRDRDGRSSTRRRARSIADGLAVQRARRS